MVAAVAFPLHDTQDPDDRNTVNDVFQAGPLAEDFGAICLNMQLDHTMAGCCSQSHECSGPQELQSSAPLFLA